MFPHRHPLSRGETGGSVPGGRVQRIVMGLAGGSGSGKTTVSRYLLERFGPNAVTVIEQDCYYRDRLDLVLDARRRLNYDHPEAFDWPLFQEHVRALRAGQTVDRPSYDFAHHARLPETRRLVPGHVVIVEGILVLWDAALRDLMDMRIFVDTDADVRFIRRLRRDITERGRAIEDVVDQYLRTVRPGHLTFVEPGKRYADVIIPEGGFNEVALDMLQVKIEALIRERERA